VGACNRQANACEGTTVCGNGTCETGETPANCCDDCPCSGSATCGADHVCTGSSTGVAPGSACTVDADCGGGGAECDRRLPGGYCLVPGCTVGGSDCPAGSFCISLGQEGACVEGRCSVDADCSRAGEGYVCDTDDSCWSYAFAEVNPSGAAMGDGCTDDAGCKSDTCLPELSNGSPTGYPGGYCTSMGRPDVQGSCPAGSACKQVEAFDATLCLDTCQDSGECRTGYSCDQGACTPTPVCGDNVCNGTETKATCCQDCGCDAGGACDTTLAPPACAMANPAGKKPGEACAQDSECMGADAQCLKLPGGYCVMPGCTVGGTDCPAGTVCIVFGEDDSGNEIDVCAAGPCTNDASCARQGEGYICDTDQSCWSYVYVPENVGGAKMGAACTQDAQCESGICIAEDWDVGFTGGYCSAACRAAVAASCPADSKCVDETDLLGVHVCAQICTQATDCRSGYACTDGACVPQ